MTNNDSLDLKIISKQMKLLLSNQEKTQRWQEHITTSLKELKDEQRATSTDVNRQGVLLEDMRDNLTLAVEGIHSLDQNLQAKADKGDIADLKQDIHTIQVAVKVTNQDLRKTKSSFTRRLKAV